MKQYTDLTVLLDRSGSMSSIKNVMESSLNELFIKHRQTPSTRVSLVQFDTDNPYEIVFENRPITEVPKVVISPRSGTPLIDTLCKAIDRTGERLANMNYSDRPDQVLFVIITDGQENSSKEFKKQDVQSRIRKQRDDYKWVFSFLGADEAGMNEALTWGLNRDHTVYFNAINAADLLDSWAVKSTTYTSNDTRSRGSAASLNYSTDEREKLAKVNNKGV